MSEFKVVASDMVPGFVELMGTRDVRDAFPHLLDALNQLASEYVRAWRGFSQGEPIPGTPRVIRSRGDYTRSIKADTSNDLVKIVYTDFPHEDEIEKGHGPIDLKPGLLSGPHAKMGKNGPYAIVPFRHGVPTSSGQNNPMPMSVYKTMQKTMSEYSDKTGASAHSRVISGGQGGASRVTEWNARLGKLPDGIRSKLVSRFIPGASNYTWKSGKHAGMVALQTSTGKAKSSKYMTFRVVSVNSDPSSWIVPPVPGINIRQAVIDKMRERTAEAIVAAITEDMQL